MKTIITMLIACFSMLLSFFIGKNNQKSKQQTKAFENANNNRKRREEQKQDSIETVRERMKKYVRKDS